MLEPLSSPLEQRVGGTLFGRAIASFYLLCGAKSLSDLISFKNIGAVTATAFKQVILEEQLKSKQTKRISLIR